MKDNTNELKIYLFNWLNANTGDDIFIGVTLNRTDVKFPFEVPIQNAQNPSIVLRVKYAKGLFVDDSGVSAFISFNPTNNFPNEELCFFPWESIFLIASEEDNYAFSFGTKNEPPQQHKPHLKLC